DRGGRGGQSRHHTDPAVDPHALASPDHRLNRGGRRDDLVNRSADSVQQLVVRDAITQLVSGHWATPSARSGFSRSLASAREAWLFTLPTEQPITTAASVSVRSSQ